VRREKRKKAVYLVRREKRKKAVYHVLELLALYEHFGGLIYIFEFSVLTVWA
jgi:hypothetical protein